MGAELILVLAACFSQAEESDLIGLKNNVQGFNSKNLWDESLEVLSRFEASHPSLKEDARFKILLRQTQDLAQEADGLFKKDIAEAEESLRKDQFAKAIAGAAGALRFYPEREPPVKELQERARAGLAAKDLIRIASNASWIGSNDRPDEPPLREVELHEFLLDKYPVTNEDYWAFIASTGATAPAHWSNGKVPKGKEDHPVVYVTYDDAAAYAKWLGKRL